MTIRRSSLVLCFVAGVALAQTPAQDFKQSCSSCHTIGGGRLTGPDLKDVAKRKDRAWLVRFINDPAGVIASGDPYAKEILAAAGGVPMPPVAGMTRDRAEALLDLIEAESAKEKSQFAGSALPERPLSPEDAARGRAIFVGTRRLANGGASCIACHTTGDVGWLGGGTLGPDLTRVFERYGDRRRLGAWLTAPATPTMLPTFKEHPLEEEEILGLVAYFRDAATNEEEDTAPRALTFILLGLAGAAGALVVFQRTWKNRFVGVRRRLVEQSRNGGMA
jgi:mono/diheme cytochrome c family protein